MPNKLYKKAVIHGRFQVLHNDHRVYLLSGAALCEHLVVGVTNPAPVQTRQETSDLNRSRKEANPLSYFERYQTIQAVLLDAGLTCLQFSIVPFPINFPDRYRHYLPMDAVFLLTIYDDWGRKKKEYFESLHLKVHILREVAPEEKGLSASDVRSLMAKGEKWEHLVPAPAAILFNQWQIPERLRIIGVS